MTTKPTAKEKLFFPNLDGLRFLCFFAVFLFHCNGTILRKMQDGTAKNICNFLFRNGEIGVNAFFVLSGFLITFLLIKEKEIKNDISLKNFYIRRILRIWPLFYGCLFLGFVIFPLLMYKAFPNPHEIANPWYYMLFACNFDFIRIKMHDITVLPDISFLAVLWSVGIEEQFYLAWPFTLKFSSSKKYPLIFLGIIFFTLTFRSFYLSDSPHDVAVRSFHTFSVIGDMAIGGMMAYFCSSKTRLLNFIIAMPKWQIILLYLATIGAILFKQDLFIGGWLIIERLILAILFAFIIAEQNFAKHSFFKFSKFKLMSKLGIYTYGLYCLHFIAVKTVDDLIEKLSLNTSSFFASMAACAAALLISIVIGLLSYHLFEKYFLNLKNKFSVIVKK